MKKNTSLSRRVCLLAGCLLLLLLSGCGEHWRPHTRREVLQYLQTEFPGEDITVAKSHSNPTEENGEPSSDRVWECWYTDLPEVVFHVESRRWTGGPAPILNYSLYQDKDRVFWSYYMEQYLRETGSLDLWETAYDGDLELYFSSTEDVSQAVEQLRAFYGWYEAQPHAGRSRSVTCHLDGLPLPSGHPVTSYIYFSTPTALADDPRLSFIHDAAEMEPLCIEMLKTYYAFYRLPSPDFSKAELAAFAEAAWAQDWTEGEARSTIPHLLRDGKTIPADLFSDIGIRPAAGSGLQFSYLSYGGLFELLDRLEMAPEGGPEHFTVKGADGIVYEFSYDFIRTDDSEIRWYYKQGGEPVTGSLYSGALSERGSAPILRIGGEEFQTITGLTFVKPVK